MEKEASLKKDMGLIVAIALVTGNMIGSGIFMLPATLASVAGPGATLLAWLITGAGSILLALSFGRLGSAIPKTGGPYEYSKLAFGDFIGFMNAWLYWNGSWIGNAAVIVAVTSYMGALFPSITNNHLYALLFSSAVLWIFTIVNIVGVKRAGGLQTVITIMKLLLFLVFIVIAAFNFDSNNLRPLFPEGKGIGTLSIAATSTLWAFVGLESASVTAGEIKNPEKNVKLSTIFGICIALAMYVGISLVSMGAMPQEKLAQSQSPIVDIFSMFVGSGIAKVIMVGAVLSIIGTTIGWLLSTARVAYAAGKDGVFPAIFGKVHPRFGTPHIALIIGAVLVNILLFLNYAGSKSMVSAFTFIGLLATLSFLPVYAFTAASEVILLVKKDQRFNAWRMIKSSIVPLLGFAYAIWTVYGSGAETVMYGFLLFLLGIPCYVYMKLKNSGQKELA